jgi:hypothetical protein
MQPNWWCRIGHEGRCILRLARRIKAQRKQKKREEEKSLSNTSWHVIFNPFSFYVPSILSNPLDKHTVRFWKVNAKINKTPGNFVLRIHKRIGGYKIRMIYKSGIPYKKKKYSTGNYYKKKKQQFDIYLVLQYSDCFCDCSCGSRKITRLFNHLEDCSFLSCANWSPKNVESAT